MTKEDVKQFFSQEARDAAKRRERIANEWKAIYREHPAVIDDLNAYVDGLRESYRTWAEEREVAGVSLDDHQIAGFLQLSKGCNIVRTYITSLIDQDVAQPIKKSK